MADVKPSTVEGSNEVWLRLTPFERGQLRFQAFDMLAEWGQPREDGKWTKWNLQERKHNAEGLANWAVCGAGLYCSFCGKSQHDVNKLIAGPLAFICNECVGLCTEIVAETCAPIGGPPSTEDQTEESSTTEDLP